MQRFLSLYFDKIYGTGPQNFGELRDYLKRELDLNLQAGGDPYAHQENCIKLARWIEKNLRGQTNVAVNPHWRPQSAKLRRVAGFPVLHLTLEGLNWQLPVVLEPIIPDIEPAMEAITDRNMSARPIRPAKLITPELQELISRIYKNDYNHHRAATESWRGQSPSETGPLLLPQIPRTDQLRVLSVKDKPLGCLPVPYAGGQALLSLLADLDLEHKDITEAHLDDGMDVLYVIRNPVERFHAFYCDLLRAEDGDELWELQNGFTTKFGMVMGPDLDEQTHQENMQLILAYIEQRINTNGADHIYGAWRPQMALAERALNFGVLPIPYPRLAETVQDIFGYLLNAPLDATVFEDRAENVPPPSPTVEEQIRTVYRTDQILWDRLITLED